MRTLRTKTNPIIVAASKTRAAAAVASALTDAGHDVVLALSLKGVKNPRRTRAGRCFILPPAEDERYVDVLLSVARQVDATVLVPTEPSAMQATAHARERFGRHGVTVVSPDPHTLDLCRDRTQLLETLRDVVPVPDGTKATGRTDAWFVQKRDRYGDDRARIVHGRHAPMKPADDEHVVEYLPGEEIWVDIVRTRDGCVQTGRSNVVRRRGRTRLMGPAPDDALVRSLSEKTAETLGLVGHATVRFRCDFIGFPRVIDVVPGFISSSFDEGGALAPLVGVALDVPPTAG